MTLRNFPPFFGPNVILDGLTNGLSILNCESHVDNLVLGKALNFLHLN